jgi:hypothetical protein
MASEIIEVVSAVILLEIVDLRFGNQVKAVKDIRITGGNIDIPVGSTIAHNKSFQVVRYYIRIEWSHLVVLVDLPCHVGDIDTSVTLSRHVEIIFQILWEFLVPL